MSEGMPLNPQEGNSNVGKIEELNGFEPTGDLLQDLEKLTTIVGSSLYEAMTDPTTGSQKVNLEDPEDVYRYFESEESKDKRNQEHDDPQTEAYVAALNRILGAYKKEQGL